MTAGMLGLIFQGAAEGTLLTAAAAGVVWIAAGSFIWSSFPETGNTGRLMLIAAGLFAAVFLSALGASFRECWPTAGNSTFLWWAVLVMAAVSASRGKNKACCPGGPLVWIIGLLLTGILIAAVRQYRSFSLNMQIKWKMPHRSLLLAILLFIPAAGLKSKKVSLPKTVLWGIPILTAVTPFLSAVLLPEKIREGRMMYFSRCLHLDGIAERFEALVSAGLTMSVFAAGSLVLCFAGEEIRKRRPSFTQKGIWLIAVFSAALNMYPEIEEYCSGIAAVIGAILTLYAAYKNNVKKW